MEQQLNALLKQESIEAKKRNKLAKIEAKKQLVLSMKALKEKYEPLLNNSQDASQKRLLKKQYSKEKSAVKKEYRRSAYHRSFVSYVDAYVSRPPLWVANLVTIAIFIGFFLYFGISSGSFQTNNQGSMLTVEGFLKGFFVPDMSKFFGFGKWPFKDSTLYLCLQTFAIAFIGTLFASILSVPFGFLASKKLFKNYSYISMVILIIIRTIPEIVFCYILITVTGFGPVTGVIVLSIQSIGMIGKMYSDALDSMDLKYLEAFDSFGSSTPTKILTGLLPQVAPNFISTILYRFDLNLRTASILGLVGAGDLGREILDFTINNNWPQLGSLIWGLLIMIFCIDLLSTWVRKKLV